MAQATMTSKGQFTLPQEIREKLGLKPGDKIEFSVPSPNQLLGRPLKRDISSLSGMLYQPGRKPISIRKMNEAIRKHVVMRKK